MTMNIRDLTRIQELDNDGNDTVKVLTDFWMQNVRFFPDLTKLQLNPGENLCSPTSKSRYQILSFYARTIVQWKGVASFFD